MLSPDGAMLATASVDGSVRFYEVDVNTMSSTKYDLSCLTWYHFLSSILLFHIAVFHSSVSMIFYLHCFALLCGSVAEWLGCWTCDQQVAGSTPSLLAVEYNPGKLLTHMCLCHQAV